MTQIASWTRRPARALVFTTAVTLLALASATAARAGEHDFYEWRDGYAGPVYGVYLAAPPYGYYYPTYSYNGYPAVRFYDGRSYYSYYYGRTDFGYQDTH
jgi:hypothetical protein